MNWFYFKVLINCSFIKIVNKGFAGIMSVLEVTRFCWIQIKLFLWYIVEKKVFEHEKFQIIITNIIAISIYFLIQVLFIV